MYLLFIIQFVGALWAKADRAAAPRRTKRLDRQFGRSTSVLSPKAELACVGWVNQSRATREGPVLSVFCSLAVALQCMRLAIFRRLGQCSSGRCESVPCETRLCLADRLLGASLIPCPAPHLRAAPRAVLRSSRSAATNSLPTIWTDRIDWD